jgi:hypothetical protein
MRNQIWERKKVKISYFEKLRFFWSAGGFSSEV